LNYFSESRIYIALDLIFESIQFLARFDFLCWWCGMSMFCDTFLVVCFQTRFLRWLRSFFIYGVRNRKLIYFALPFVRSEIQN
jgi:hypothetical protein